METAGKGTMRSLGFVTTVAVMLLFCGVAKAGNPCFRECYERCGENCEMLDITCHGGCAYKCGLQDTCEPGSGSALSNSVKPEEALVMQSHTIEKNTVEKNVADNPCYAECVQDCLNSCSFVGCASCPITCSTRNTCKSKINSAKPEEVVIQSHTIEKSTVEKNVADNPCYAECVQDCLNTCTFVGCASCPITCSTRDTCKSKINSAKPEEALVIQSYTIKKNAVEKNVADNPCYAECVQDCLNTCSFVGCASCPIICGTHNTCENKLNSGELKAAAMNQFCKVGCASSVCAPMANILRLNSVADKQGSIERCNYGCSGFCNKHFAVSTE